MEIVYRGFYPESQRSESKETAFGTVAEWLNATACKAVWGNSRVTGSNPVGASK